VGFGAFRLWRGEAAESRYDRDVCLIVVAYRAFDRFPLVIAANRDEDYDRPTRSAHRWDEAPEVIGGRDVLHGGSWLAVTSRGRFAAVTNLRGDSRPDARSRGLLVRDFVASSDSPRAYVEDVQRHAREYAGFHLIAGEVGGAVMHLSDELRVWEPGVYGVGNDAIDTRSERVERAVDFVRTTTDAATLLDFLGRGSAFIAAEQYGTRSSTVIIASRDELRFAERTYGRGGVRQSDYSLALPMCTDVLSSTSVPWLSPP
jgi:uncharacterized protein with NRDE domain